MKVLLDTHALLWALLEPEKLSPKAREIIEDTGNTLYVSSASALEISTKFRLGRLPGAKNVVEKYRRHLAALGAAELPITAEHALLAGSLTHQHRDPFDRMLAAQAECEDFPLVSQDPLLAGFNITILW